MQRDIKSIASDLPPAADNILDIGCGLAAIDVLLYRHFSKQSPPGLYLADFEETSHRLDYNFGRSPARYNSLQIARQLLIDNGIPPEAFHLINPEQVVRGQDLPKFELVLSTLAWGFHFPVDTYAQAVFNLMAEGGRLILDIRKNTGGIEQLEKIFTVDAILEENETRQRVLAIKPGVL